MFVVYALFVVILGVGYPVSLAGFGHVVCGFFLSVVFERGCYVV